MQRKTPYVGYIYFINDLNKIFWERLFFYCFHVQLIDDLKFYS